MNCPYQIQGTALWESKSIFLMLCRDADKPDEAMLHWWQSGIEPGAIKCKIIEKSKDFYTLEPMVLYVCDKRGGMVLPQLTQEALGNILKWSGELHLKAKTLTGTFRNPEGKSGQMKFSWSNSNHKLKPKKLKNWSDFKTWASATHSQGVFNSFRGHGSNNFRLKTTFHRNGRTRLERFAHETMPEFTNHAEVSLNAQLQAGIPEDYSTLLGLAQHYGLPTPLLDWTASPYIAAFFAFADALEYSDSRKNETHIRIFGLSKVLSDIAYPIVTIPFIAPYVAYLAIAPRLNPRLYAQQGRFLVSNMLDIENELIQMGKTNGKELLVAVDVPISCAIEALEDLHFMGLTAASMFPGLDGVCKMMKHKMAYKR
jgi:hypothetical protein